MLRLILQGHSKTPIELLYLETGTVPIRYIIKARRLTYLRNILTKNKNELISRVYYAQKRKPVRDDWFLTVKHDLEELDIQLSETELISMSKYKFKKFIKAKISVAAFKYLEKLRKGHKKGTNINYDNLEMQSYLTSYTLNNEQKIFLFKLRSEMTNVKSNFSSMYTDVNCDICDENVPQTDSHLLDCIKILNMCQELRDDNTIEYEDIYGSIEVQMKAVNIYKAIFKIKEKIEETL